MNNSSNSLALTMKDAAKLVGVDCRTIKLGIENGTIPTIQLGPRRMIPAFPCSGRSGSTPDGSSE
ncbi:helix-turn-helix transcriptional regulator [Microbacterium oleivorans]|uniref:helix-turn-helix transcriptional regulator n=1 Tax=Microbacterium oleivorans TaxID=273677 RepID=UPI000AE3D1E7|nr:DNA-binding protein [Microbacterium oleivorans]